MDRGVKHEPFVVILYAIHDKNAVIPIVKTHLF